MIAFFTTGRNRVRALILSLFALVLAACEPIAMGGLGSAGGARIDTSQPIPVALLVPRGGSAADDLLAQNLENAARLAMASLDGVEVDLRVYGTAGTAAQASTAASQAVNDGAKLILGPVYAEAANAAGVAAAGAGVNVLSFSNNPTIAGGNVFVLGSTFNNTANRLIEYGVRNGRNRVVILHSDDLAGQLGRSAIAGAAAANGASIAATVDYAPSQQAVVAAVPRVRSAIDSTGADTLFLTTSSASALPLFSQLLPEAGVQPATTQFMGLTRWDIPPQTLALPGVQGGWFALPDPAAAEAFRARYSATYGGEPHPLAGLAFDGIAAVGALARSGQSDALTASALTQGAGFQGATGIFRFRGDGTNERGLAVATIRNQSVVILDPAPRGFGGAGF
jgi:hypothetical protein